MKQQQKIPYAHVDIITSVDHLLMGDSALFYQKSFLNRSICSLSISQFRLQPKKEYEAIEQQSSLNYALKQPSTILLISATFSDTQALWEIRCLAQSNSSHIQYEIVLSCSLLRGHHSLMEPGFLYTVFLALGSSNLICA